MRTYWERRGAAIYTEDDGTPGKAACIADLHPIDTDIVQRIVVAHNNDGTRTDHEIVEQTNELAILALGYIGTGYVPAKDGYKVYVHLDGGYPRDKKAWRFACEVQELLTGTEPDEALNNLIEDGEITEAAPVMTPAAVRTKPDPKAAKLERLRKRRDQINEQLRAMGGDN